MNNNVEEYCLNAQPSSNATISIFSSTQQPVNEMDDLRNWRRMMHNKHKIRRLNASYNSSKHHSTWRQWILNIH